MKAIVSAVVAAAAMILPAGAGARDEAKVIMPDNPSPGRIMWGWSDAVVTGDTVYLSGVVAMTEPGDKSLEDAYGRAFERMGAVLKKAGVSWDDVVEITSFHTDVTTQMNPMAKVKSRYIRAPFPAWTAIQVARLIPDKGITEIKLVAKLPSRLQPLSQ